MSRLTRDGTAEPVSRDQILRHARGQGNINFPCSADHEQDWQPYPVDPYSAICDDHTYIHTVVCVLLKCSRLATRTRNSLDDRFAKLCSASDRHANRYTHAESNPHLITQPNAEKNRIKMHQAHVPSWGAQMRPQQRLLSGCTGGAIPAEFPSSTS